MSDKKEVFSEVCSVWGGSVLSTFRFKSHNLGKFCWANVQFCGVLLKNTAFERTQNRFFQHVHFVQVTANLPSTFAKVLSRKLCVHWFEHALWKRHRRHWQNIHQSGALDFYSAHWNPFLQPPQKELVFQTAMQICSWTWPSIAPWGIWSDDVWGRRCQERKLVQFKQRSMQDLDPSSTGDQNLAQALCQILTLDCARICPCWGSLCKILPQTNKHQNCTRNHICKILPPCGFAVCSSLLNLHLSKI